jgi:hypothetical protein
LVDWYTALIRKSSKINVKSAANLRLQFFKRQSSLLNFVLYCSKTRIRMKHQMSKSSVATSEPKIYLLRAVGHYNIFGGCFSEPFVSKNRFQSLFGGNVLKEDTFLRTLRLSLMFICPCQSNDPKPFFRDILRCHNTQKKP